jgi:GNAT superfamily N-acetyltransferase
LRELAAELGYSLLVRTYCWDCGEEVYLLAKPDGGFVILDDRGPDWPVHPCYRGGGSATGGTSSHSSRPSLLHCQPEYQVPVPVGVHELRDLHDGHSIRATIVAIEGREAVLCDGEHLYRLVLRGPGRLGECVEGSVKRRGLHWELSVVTVIQPQERKMTEAHAQEIATLLNERNQLARLYSAQGIVQHADEYEYEVREGRVVACVERKKVQWYQWEICHLSVRKEWEGKGVGFAVYSRAEAAARSGGACVLQCTIREGNEASERFFRRQSFNKVGAFLYGATGNTVGVWQKVLSSPEGGAA